MGNFKNNIREGYGKQIWPDGATYEGNFSKDMANG